MHPRSPRDQIDGDVDRIAELEAGVFNSENLSAGRNWFVSPKPADDVDGLPAGREGFRDGRFEVLGILESPGIHAEDGAPARQLVKGLNRRRKLGGMALVGAGYRGPEPDALRLEGGEGLDDV